MLHIILTSDELELILLQVAYSLELDGVRGPSIVVRDLVSAASTCVAMRSASSPAIAWLARECNVLDDEHDWETLLRAPMSLRALKLREAAFVLDTYPSGVKAVVSARIRLKFGVNDSSEMRLLPATLLRTLHLERTTCTGTRQSDMYWMYNFLFDHHVVAERVAWWWPWSVLRTFVQRQYPTITHLMAAVEGYMTTTSVVCTCGNLAATACTVHKCGACCTTCVCFRHRRNKKRKKFDLG